MTLLLLHWRRAAAVPALLAGAALAHAETAAAPAPGIPASAYLQTLLVLAAVLALFVGAAWLARRLGMTRPGGHGPLRVIASVPLGARERIILVEIGETWLVVGIVPGQIRTLQALPRGAAPMAGNDGHAFADWLKQLSAKPDQ